MQFLGTLWLAVVILTTRLVEGCGSIAKGLGDVSSRQKTLQHVSPHSNKTCSTCFRKEKELLHRHQVIIPLFSGSKTLILKLSKWPKTSRLLQGSMNVLCSRHAGNLLLSNLPQNLLPCEVSECKTATCVVITFLSFDTDSASAKKPFRDDALGTGNVSRDFLFTKQ